MKERLAAIDAASIEELQRIKAEQDVILQRLKLMEEKRSAVSEEVFGRVLLDYEGRMNSLEDEAGPLKERARIQHGALKILLLEIEASVKTAEMDREELQLRHDLGEFADETYSEALKEHEDRVEGHHGDLAEAQALKEGFLSAFYSEEELEDGAEPDPALSISDEEPEDLEVEGDPDAPVSQEGPPPIPWDDENDHEESDDPPEFEAEEAVPVAMEAKEIPDLPELDSLLSLVEDDGTMILRWPKLILQAENGDFEQHTVVGGSTILGSGSACDIVITGAKVAERHAEIIMIADGHMIRDLESSVGTLVNGVEISEWKLAGGDSIQLGEAVLIFKQG